MAPAEAELLLRQRLVVAPAAFVEIVLWRVPTPVRGSRHDVKYRMALIEEGRCVLRYDNEAGKGDHRHVGSGEAPYRFESLEALQADFWADVGAWLERRDR